ncbi:MAG TPA: hypothetical protein VJT16_08555 [Streptosporangiaceae bacterium]|nr:hypothetical protein [Streptosporangiaceae bacterium]
MASARPNHKDNPTENTVQLARSRAGVVVVVAGDVVIALAAFIGISKFSAGSSAGVSMVAILTTAFAAISTMTTAYFGIKTVSNTAQSFAKQLPQAGLVGSPLVQDGPGSGDSASAQPDDESGEPGQQPVPQPAT